MLSQRMINLTITKVISLTLIFSIIGCEANGVIQSSKANKEVEKNITSLTNIINSSNVNILEQLNDPALMKMLAEDPDSEFPAGEPILAVEEEQALKELYANPEKVFREIAKEEDGEEFISLMTAIVEQKDPEEIRSKLAYLLTVEELAEFDEQVKRIENEIQALAKTMAGYDKYLHFMAGVAVAMLAAAIIYKKCKWLQWKTKAATIVAYSIAGALFIGTTKELHDYFRRNYNFTPSSADIWYTIAGGATGGVAMAMIGTFFIAIGVSTVTGKIIYGLSSAILGFDVVRSFKTGKTILIKKGW